MTMMQISTNSYKYEHKWSMLMGRKKSYYLNLTKSFDPSSFSARAYSRLMLIGDVFWVLSVLANNGWSWKLDHSGLIQHFTPPAEVPITQCSAAKEERQTCNSIVFFLPVYLALSFPLSLWQLGVPEGMDNWNTCPFLEENQGWWSLTYGFRLWCALVIFLQGTTRVFFTQKQSALPLLLLFLFLFFDWMSSAVSMKQTLRLNAMQHLTSRDLSNLETLYLLFTWRAFMIDGLWSMICFQIP